MDSDEEIISLLNEVNGIYIPGDSQKAIVNKKYQKAFSTITQYVIDQNKKNGDYFPMFMMGKSCQTLIAQLGASKATLQDMKSWKNRNTELKLMHQHNDTFLLHQLQYDPSLNHAFTLGEFFNRQQTGFRLRELKMDDKLRKWFNPIATFKDSGNADASINFVTPKEELKYDPELEFVAIAEANDIPMYIFTYNVEMTQFVYTDIMVSENQEEIIDKSIPARHHAQFISAQIADEARLNNHKFELSEEDFAKLIMHHKVVTVEYAREGTSTDKNHSMPRGLEKHDVYLLEQKQRAQEKIEGERAPESTEHMLNVI